MFTSSITTPLGYICALVPAQMVSMLLNGNKPFLRRQIKIMMFHVKQHISSCFIWPAIYRCFTLPLDLSGQSEAFRRWLTVMSAIPYGRPSPIKISPNEWGNEKAARAAGQACQRNPLPIILPCHRVVQSDGTFDNYSGGDKTARRDPKNIKRKQWLIDLEARHRRTA